MDLTIEVEDYKLNVRAAGIIIHNNKVLTHRNLNSNHYTFIGGRVEIGEDSASTVKREIEEEVGKEVEIIEHGGVIENFFEMQGTKYHEMLFMHRAEFVDEEDQKIEYTLKNREGKDYLQYEWIDIDHLDDYPIKPAIIKEILKQGKFPVHMINKD
ncbi:MAG: NUDIX domain-containing protein [Clostridium sp.]|jgi:ADP-ribose pyrophosphatase YjhB (NUDIX family)|nr:NUDIX domain-containing protein [Clostridium sp.]